LMLSRRTIINQAHSVLMLPCLVSHVCLKQSRSTWSSQALDLRIKSIVFYPRPACFGGVDWHVLWQPGGHSTWM
jgi:hypothetical protein